MIQPLYTLVFTEVGLILLLVFRTPLRKPLLILLDKLKQGKGPVVASSAGATLFAVLVSILYSIAKIRKRSLDAGTVNPTDQVLLANHLLEASLLGFTLFLALMIDRLHYYIKELGLVRKHLEAVTKLDQKHDDKKGKQAVGAAKDSSSDEDEEKED